MNSKKISIGLFALALILGIAFFFYFRAHEKTQDTRSANEVSQAEVREIEPIKATSGYGAMRKTSAKNEAALLKFVKDKLTGKAGIYTNFLDTSENQEVATGHEVLSESSGLLLRYSGLAKDRELYNQTWETALKTFDDKGQFSYRFSPKLDKRYSVNAVVDDLRLVRGLFEGDYYFSDKSLGILGEKYGKRLLKTNIEGDELVDFHDSQTDQRNSFVTLCYIDLRTLELIPFETTEKTKLLTQQTAILKDGYLGDDFPFYQTRYDYQKQVYFDSEEINVVESLLTILHLAEVKQANPKSIAFVKEQVMKGSLANRYSKTGKVVDANQSAAAYGIAAMIASEVADQEFYNKAMDQMEKSQIQDSTSPLNGGYGDSATKAAFSFNNLIALLAYQY